MMAIFVMPHSCRLLKSIFIFTMGSLLWAVPLWRNSLVFHDVDKVFIRWHASGNFVLCAAVIFHPPTAVPCRCFRSFGLGVSRWRPHDSTLLLIRSFVLFDQSDRQMTSCFIHLFPSWLALTLRWYPLDPMRGGVPGATEPECQDGIDKEDVGTAMALYLLWQVLYYIKTEVADKVRCRAYLYVFC